MPIDDKNIIIRPILATLIKYLPTDDILVIHGARQVGKTNILYSLERYLRQNSRPVYYLDLEDSRFREILDGGPDSFLNFLRQSGFLPQTIKAGEKFFVLLDEIQYLQNPSSFLKLIVDHHRYLKLIVSGSSSFAIKSKFKDSLVGRTLDFEVFPLSFKEFLTFKRREFQPAVFKAGASLSAKIQDELGELYQEYILYGGYPKIVLTADINLKEQYLQQIIDTYIRKDIKDLADIKETDKFNKLVQILASQSGRMLNIGELANTCRLAARTVERYLFILENTYILKLVKPYYKNLRSELSKTPKVFFYDTGLMQILWLRRAQKEIIGSVFETSVFSELVKAYGRENINYWRTQDKKEIDFILRDKDKLLPLEVKMNFAGLNKTALDYFSRRYNINDYRVVGLKGLPQNKKFIFPWNI